MLTPLGVGDRNVASKPLVIAAVARITARWYNDRRLGRAY